MGRETRATWARRVRRWTRSGLTAERFARQEGVNPGTLLFWRWKLRQKAPGGRRQAPAKRTTASPVDFVELVPARPSRVAGAPAAALELVLTAGYRVRLGAGFDRETLTQLLDVLEVRQ
jgi:transposase